LLEDRVVVRICFRVAVLVLVQEYHLDSEVNLTLDTGLLPEILVSQLPSIHILNLDLAIDWAPRGGIVKLRPVELNLPGNVKAIKF
jgi:hypothetical protein